MEHIGNAHDGNPRLGVCFRNVESAGTYTGYSFNLRYDAGNKWELARNSTSCADPDEFDARIDISALDYAPSGTDVIKIILLGTSIKCYINNVEFIDTVDGTYPSGGAGGFVWCKNTGDYDNLKIYKSEIITMNGLEDGQKFRIRKAGDVVVATSAGAGGGQATIDLSGEADRPPYHDLQVLDDDDSVLFTDTVFEDNIWGGDIFLYD
ncbi:hypothetical protein ES705_33133 [subsurface metagenome]